LTQKFKTSDLFLCGKKKLISGSFFCKKEKLLSKEREKSINVSFNVTIFGFKKKR